MATNDDAPTPCPACAIERIFAGSLRRDPPGPGASYGHGYAWLMGAARLGALVHAGKPATVALCEEHTTEYVELLEQGTGASVEDRRPPAAPRTLAS